MLGISKHTFFFLSKVKVMLSLPVPWRHRAVVEVTLYLVLTLAPVGGERSICPSYFTPSRWYPFDKRLGGPQSLYGLFGEKYLCASWDWNPYYPAHSIILFSCCKESVSVIICTCSLELVLKQEQEEYQREGIEWKKIDYFNNQIICDLVEQPHKGVIAIMDEACINVGKVTDEVFCYHIIFLYILWNSYWIVLW